LASTHGAQLLVSTRNQKPETENAAEGG